eukprot:CAMPEP_0170451732 /NCGR_PEP_ID=MMETSP0123-20130129/874_1 /TAXON_ID=182087 /ORGANISM="Favella ehrenbergii, Strain Fehren 1" /LENGTH=330 /DNA_ID=CAMNT_0010713519 /DNA_START=158 /DNA_END=1150 /DNA_ORIENTATION=-
MGAGILGVPYAIYHMGLPLGTAMIIFIAAFTQASIVLMLKTAQLAPCKPKSVYEIAYLLYGRTSIFFLCIIMLISGLGAIALFYRMIGDTFSTVLKDGLMGPNHGQDGSVGEEGAEGHPWWVTAIVHEKTLIVLAGLLQTPVIFKRQLEEMKVISYSFAIIALVFTFLLIGELYRRRDYVSEHIDWDDLKRAKLDAGFVTSLNILILSFSMHWIILPTYSELENRTVARFVKAVRIELSIFTIVFLTIGYSAAILFGSKINSLLLLSLAELDGLTSIFCRIMFVVLLMFHIPYYFYMEKEFCLVLYDEVYNRSMSTRLEQKLQSAAVARG